MVHIQSLLYGSLTFALAAAIPSAATRQACNDITAALPGLDNVARPNSMRYNSEINDYYNHGLANLKPACVTFPKNALDVSKIVQVLNKYPDVKFAVKSGGHSPNEGAASVADGVLVALRDVTGTQYDAAKQVAYVKPGGHWFEVLAALAPTGRTVVGGRLGIVGIGGYLMQGGVSFISGQYGLAADNIVEYETVLANGTIAKINMDNNKDLMQAMRGAGSQFGITTKFTLRTYPIEKLWVGVRVYEVPHADFYNAFQDFIDNYSNHPNSATLYPLLASFDGIGPKASQADLQTKNLMQQAFDSLAGYSALRSEDYTAAFGTTKSAAAAAPKKNGTYIFPLLVNGPEPTSGTYAEMDKLPVKNQFGGSVLYADIINVSNAIWPLLGSMRTSFRTITLPTQKGNPGFFAEIESMWNEISAKHYKTAKGIVSHNIVAQPFPQAFGNESEARGGNAMGLTAKDKGRYVLEIAGLYVNDADAAMMQAVGKEFTDTLERHLQRTLRRNVLQASAVESYLPLFMNDAGSDQDVFGTYKEAAKIAALQKSVDPNGLWSKRAGGYKIRTGI
ncbi:FAD-binding domain-containing protein [Aulographum hederae CBS 113979]|uniref:FAD-binding domain-containing protein n=1 Tax=Aulographum hederae CBS 113979 TaxID=1176131 RepID=A0A6G1H8H0_9PEZI|nr:FAD-binding domain-containing protein [Aulographum hederae CBS 113979]